MLVLSISQFCLPKVNIGLEPLVRHELVQMSPLGKEGFHLNQGIARTQSPTNKNYAFELPTFGVIVEVNPTVVQWKGLTLEEPPS